MNHFVHKMKTKGGQPPEERHLLILDGQKSNISLEVLMKAKENGIDMISLPLHINHELQILDKTCFKPFKVAFKAYKDMWNLKTKAKNEGRKT